MKTQKEYRKELLQRAVADGMKRCKTCLNMSEISRFFMLRHGKKVESKKCAVCREYFKEWQKQLRLKRTDVERSAYNLRRRQENESYREQVLSHYGKKCACCGDTHLDFLQIDHVNGGGCKHRRQIGSLMRWLVRQGFPDDFRTLCANCNFARGLHGCCPHETERQIEVAPQRAA